MPTIATMTSTTEDALDRDLVGRCLAGDADQFRHLVRRYQRVVVAHLRLRLRPSALEDAAQETFVRAYRNLDKLRSPDAFFAWLLGIADRVARESGRHEARRLQLIEAYSAEAPQSSGAGPAARRDAELDSAVQSLSEPLRQVVLLRFYGDRSCADIARLLQIPVSTVTKRLSRAYEHLRRRIDR